jgi:hypothetical protein
MNRLLVCGLAALVINLVCAPSAPAQSDKEAQRVYKVKHDVDKIGTDENVKVTLLDGTKLKGRISEIGADYFVVVEKKTANPNRISFAQVKQVKSIVDNPLGDPAVLLGLALIPAIIGLAVLTKGQ